MRPTTRDHKHMGPSSKEISPVQPLQKTVWLFLRTQKQKFHLIQQFHYWVHIQRILYHSTILTHAHVCLLQHCSTIAKTWNQPKCSSMIDWIKKMWHMYTMEYYAATKKDELTSFAETWMKLEMIILSKLIQEQKIKHHMFSLTGRC